MARTYYGQPIVVFDRGTFVRNISRIVFGELGGYGVPPRPEATGLIRYDGAVATVHRDPDGVLFIDLAEPLMRGYQLPKADWN